MSTRKAVEKLSNEATRDELVKVAKTVKAYNQASLNTSPSKATKEELGMAIGYKIALAGGLTAAILLAAGGGVKYGTSADERKALMKRLAKYGGDIQKMVRGGFKMSEKSVQEAERKESRIPDNIRAAASRLGDAIMPGRGDTLKADEKTLRNICRRVNRDRGISDEDRQTLYALSDKYYITHGGFRFSCDQLSLEVYTQRSYNFKGTTIRALNQRTILQRRFIGEIAAAKK